MISNPRSPFEVFPGARAHRHYITGTSRERLHHPPKLVSYLTVRISRTWLPGQTMRRVIRLRPHNSVHQSHHRMLVARAQMVTLTWTDSIHRSLGGHLWPVCRQAMLPVQGLRTLLDLSSHPHTTRR